jgi:hypothetical protein
MIGVIIAVVATTSLLFAGAGIVIMWTKKAIKRNRRSHENVARIPDNYCSIDYAGYFDAPEGLIIDRIPQREDGHRCLSSRAF